MNQYDDENTRSVVVLAPGTLVSHYCIEKKLGQGGMGEVYLARDTKLDRKLVLKFLSAQFSSDSTFKERFFREARAAAKLNHPNIITIYEVAEYESRIFIAMEFISGQTLRDIIDSSRPNLEHCLEIITQICQGLTTAHKSGLVHRDIKPSNIMLDENQRVRILDFGLAKHETDQQLTQAGTVIGTVNYMSPEQSRGENLDHLSDMFSVGVVAYELLTGECPFKRKNIPATLHAIVSDTPPPLTDFFPGIMPELQTLIERSLQKKADERFISMKQMTSELETLLGRSGDSSMRISAISSMSKVASLAVLYLRNLGSEEDDFLSYGITEDLIIDISRIASVRVMPMRSILKFKNSDESLEKIASELNVDFVLDGSIHRSDKLIRISAQLLEITDGACLWSDRWEQPVDSLPEIKKNLAQGISEALEFGQTVIRKAQLGISKVKHAGAYENYLRGKYTFEHKENHSDVQVALEMYERALEEEPSLLAAKIGIAEVHIFSREFEKAESELIEALEKAKKNKLIPEEGDILCLLSRHHSQHSDWGKAREYGGQALNIKRNLNDIAGEAEVLGLLISEAQAQGNFDEVIRMFDRVLEIARQLDDRDKIAEALKNMGVAFARKGEYDQANELYLQSLKLAKECENHSLEAACLSNLGNLAYFHGNLSKAYDQYEQACQIETRLGDKAGIARHTLNMGLVQLRRLQFREGLELLTQASATFERLGDRAMFAMALLNESQARLNLGQVDLSTEAAEKALAISIEIGHPLSHSNALLRIASVQLFKKEYDLAIKSFESAKSIAGEAGLSRNVVIAELGLAESYYESGKIEESKSWTSKGLAVAREMGEELLIIKASILSAVLTMEKGLVNMGIDQLERLIKEAGTCDDIELTLYAQYQLGRSLLKYSADESAKNKARSILDSSLSQAREFELVPLVKLIEAIPY